VTMKFVQHVYSTYFRSVEPLSSLRVHFVGSANPDDVRVVLHRREVDVALANTVMKNWSDQNLDVKKML